jgi:hypothetical protein
MGTITPITFVNTVFTIPDTANTGSQSFTSGRRIWVIASAASNFHGNGLGANWGISDNASSNTISWTQRGLSSIIDSVDPDLRLQCVVWSSSELTSNESFTITVDPNTGGSGDQYYIHLTVVEFTGGDGTVAQAVGFELGLTDEETVTLSGAPSSHQLLVALGLLGASVTWDADPSDFTTIAALQDESDGGAPSTALESTANTSAMVTYGFDQDPDYLALILIEFNEDLGGVVSGQIARTESVALPGMAVGAHIIPGQVARSESRALAGTVQGVTLPEADLSTTSSAPSRSSRQNASASTAAGTLR